MKTIKTFFSIIAFAAISNLVSAQTSNSSTSNFCLMGKWKVQCILEKVSQSSISFCGLCAANDASTNNELHINNFEMAFSNDSLTITQDGKATTVAYIRNKNNYAFSFEFNKSKHSFRVFSLDKLMLIESKDGQLLALTKTE